LRDRNGAGAGDHTIAGPLSKDVACGDSLLIDQNQPTPQSEIPSARRVRHDEAKAAIAVLSELFPAVIVADRWAPHRPLRVGIRADLVATGLLTPSECSDALRHYCVRLQYQRALAAGGARFDLDGNPVGAVTPDDIERAQAAVARMEAKQAAKATAARQVAVARMQAKTIARAAAAHQVAKTGHASQQPSPPQSPAPPPSPPTQESAAPRRLGLADLRAAALARREAAR